MIELREDQVNFINYRLVGDVCLNFENEEHMIGRLHECIRGEGAGEYYLFREMTSVTIKRGGFIIPEIVVGLEVFEYDSEVYFLIKNETIITIDVIYVVHISYFMECRIVYYEGMHGIYGIQGTSEQEDERFKDLFPVSYSRAEFRGQVMHFVRQDHRDFPGFIQNFAKLQYMYQTRLRWVSAIHNGLKSTRGRGGFRFEISINLDFLYYCMETLRNNSDGDITFQYLSNQSSNNTRLVRRNGILSLPTGKDIVRCSILDVKWMNGILGNNWHMYPLVDHNAVLADIESTFHAFIPELNCGINIDFDYEKLVMKFQAFYVSRETKRILLSKRTNLSSMMKIWKQDLEGICVYDPEDQSYNKIVLVEQNFKDFVSKNRKKQPLSCCIAWLLKFDNYEYVEDPDLEDHCRDDEDLRLLHCFPYEVQDIMATCEPIMNEAELQLVRERLFSSVPRPGPLEIQDESGLDLSSHVFVKKQRCFKENPDNMTQFLYTVCEPLLEDANVNSSTKYFIEELLKESKQLNINYRLRFKEQLEYYEGSVGKLVSLFSSVPFNLLTPEQLQQLTTYGRKKGEAIDFAVGCFMDSVC